MTPAEKGKITRQKHQAAWKAKEAQLQAEREATTAALRNIRDDDAASPEARLRAVELLMELKRNRYI